MGYTPFTNDYSTLRTPAYVANELARRTAEQSRVNDIVVGGNRVMGGLVADCCSDPAFAGQGFYDPNSPGDGSPGTIPAGAYGFPVPAGYDPLSVLPTPGVPYALTPVDILTGSYGFPIRRDGRPWPRPRLPRRNWKALVAAYPNYTEAGVEVRGLVPPCPCNAPAPIPLAAPVVMNTPAPHETVASERARLAAWRAGLSGLGQDSNPLSGVGGLLAVVAAAGILVWANRK